MVVKCEKEIKHAPPHFQWNLDTDLNSALCWPILRNNPTAPKVDQFTAAGNFRTGVPHQPYHLSASCVFIQRKLTLQDIIRYNSMNGKSVSSVVVTTCFGTPLPSSIPNTWYCYLFMLHAETKASFVFTENFQYWHHPLFIKQNIEIKYLRLKVLFKHKWYSWMIELEIDMKLITCYLTLIFCIREHWLICLSIYT